MNLIKNRPLKSFLFVFLLMVLPVVNATEFGQLDGQFSVDPQGNATYQISIQVQPGVNGTKPSLGLSYSSREGNGHLGVG